MNNLTQLLDQLADLRHALDSIRLSKQDAVDAAIPPEVKADLAAIDLEYAPMIEEAEARCAALEQQVKTEVLAHGATVKGARVQAVYIRGRVTWDAKALDGYAMDHPELFVFRKEGAPSVSIRAVK